MSLKKILACLTRADLDYNLIEDNDRIAVGVSGGKDSMLLLKALKQYQMFPIKNFTFCAVFLDLGFGNVDQKTLTDFCASLQIPLHIEDATEVAHILSCHKTSSGNLPCSICSRMKKAAINKVAHELRCNKVAFAHHCDDALETLLMNTIYGGRIATFAPKMLLSNTDLVFIRPFLLVREKDIVSTCRSEGIPIIKSACPNDHVTMREEAKTMLNSIYRTYPSAYNNYRNMLQNEEHFDMWFDKKEYPLLKGYTIRKCHSQADYFQVMAIRQTVFCAEQGIPVAEEFSPEDSDERTVHFLLKHRSQPIGTISYIDEGNKTYRLRRFALLKEYRSSGVGRRMLQYVESYISVRTNPCLLYLHAQKGLEPYYVSTGFHPVGAEFVEAGIPHIRMEKAITDVLKYKIRPQQ